jgi:hypothetical protein
MIMRRVAKIDSLLETKPPRRGRKNGLWWVFLFIWVASLLTATDNGWALDNTSLKGTYVIHEMQAAFGAPDSNGG